MNVKWQGLSSDRHQTNTWISAGIRKVKLLKSDWKGLSILRRNEFAVCVCVLILFLPHQDQQEDPAGPRADWMLFQTEGKSDRPEPGEAEAGSSTDELSIGLDHWCIRIHTGGDLDKNLFSLLCELINSLQKPDKAVPVIKPSNMLFRLMELSIPLLLDATMGLQGIICLCEGKKNNMTPTWPHHHHHPWICLLLVLVTQSSRLCHYSSFLLFLRRGSEARSISSSLSLLSLLMKKEGFFFFLLLFGWSSDAWNIHSCCVLCETIPLSSGKNQESLLGLVWKAAAKENKNDSRNRKKAPQVTPNNGGFIQSIGNDSADWQIYVLMRLQEN